MGFLKGRLTVRRYRVIDPLPDGFRDAFEAGLTEHAFQDHGSASRGEESVGWVCPDNLLDTDFDLRDRWLFDHYVMVGMRVDKKVLPAKLFRAMIDKRLRDWCQENGRAHAPASVRTDVRSAIESELLARTLPRVQMVPMCWNLAEGWLLFHSTADGMNDKFRTLFRRTFGLVPEPFTPLDFLSETEEVAEALSVVGMTDFGAGGGA